MAYKGKYKPNNPEKYSGNSNNIIYRSLWERKFMVYCDNNPQIVEWSSEEVVVPYISPVDKKQHRYFPDFVIKTEEGKVVMIEIKPEAQTKVPVFKKHKRKQKMLAEMKTYEVNRAKWAYAKAFCAKYGWEFRILTEKHLKV